MFRELKITRAMNGFIVEVGCQTVVFETMSGLVTALIDYVADPTKCEQEWAARYGYKTTNNGWESAMPPPPPNVVETYQANSTKPIYRGDAVNRNGDSIRGIGR